MVLNFRTTPFSRDHPFLLEMENPQPREAEDSCALSISEGAAPGFPEWPKSVDAHGLCVNGVVFAYGPAIFLLTFLLI